MIKNTDMIQNPDGSIVTLRTALSGDRPRRTVDPDHAVRRAVRIASSGGAVAQRCASCGAPIGHFGVCSDCYARVRREELAAEMRPPLATIPRKYRDAVWGSAAVWERVPQFAKMPPPSDLLAARGLILVGESGAGKTTIATALMRHTIDGVLPESDPTRIEHARGARFVDAHEVPKARQPADKPNQAKVARVATLLVLDDVGNESEGMSGFEANDAHAAIHGILHDIDRDERSFIITTGGDEHAWQEWYGPAIARRYWEMHDVQIVEMAR